MRHDSFAERLALGIVGCKSTIDIVVIGKRLRESLGLCGTIATPPRDPFGAAYFAFSYG